MKKYNEPELKILIYNEDICTTSAEGARYDTTGEDINWGGFFS